MAINTIKITVIKLVCRQSGINGILQSWQTVKVSVTCGTVYTMVESWSYFQAIPLNVTSK